MELGKDGDLIVGAATLINDQTKVELDDAVYAVVAAVAALTVAAAAAAVAAVWLQLLWLLLFRI